MLTTSVDFKKYLRTSLDIVMLKGRAAQEAASDPLAFAPGLAVLAIGGLAVALGAVFEGVVSTTAEALFLVILSPVLHILMFTVFIAMFHGVARLFGGKATFQEYYRATALSWIVTWAQAVPYAGALLSLWSIPVNIVVLESVHKLRRIEAVAVIAVMTSAAMGFLYFTGMLG